MLQKFQPSCCNFSQRHCHSRKRSQR